MYESPKTGSLEIKGAYKGSTPARRCYVGGTLVFQGFGPASEQEFVQQEAAGGPAQLLKVYGKSIVNNQLVQPSFWPSGGPYFGVTFTNNGDGTYTANGTATGLAYQTEISTVYVTQGHKYLMLGADSDNAFKFNIYSPAQFGGSGINAPAIIQAVASGLIANFRIIVSAGKTVNNSTIRPQFIDLTLRFGAGSEPTSVDEALRLLGGDAFNPTYDPGSLQSNKTAELRAKRVPVINVWDEEWEPGSIYYTNGRDFSVAGYFRSASYVPVSPGDTLYITNPNNANIIFYDDDKIFIDTGTSYINKRNTTFIVPNNAAFLRIATAGTTYQNDICINLSDPAINGTYYPHWRGSLALNLATLTGKLNGEGASVVVFPDGLRGVGTDRDAAYGSTGVVGILKCPSLKSWEDMGTYSWDYSGINYRGVTFRSILQSRSSRAAYKSVTFGQASAPGVLAPNQTSFLWVGVSNETVYHLMSVAYASSIGVYDSVNDDIDLTAYKSWLQGVDDTIIYPLATPQTYTLDTPLPTDFTCVQGDILQRVSDNNCPFVGEMKFGL